jgi:hypothetical protein
VKSRARVAFSDAFCPVFSVFASSIRPWFSVISPSIFQNGSEDGSRVASHDSTSTSFDHESGSPTHSGARSDARAGPAEVGGAGGRGSIGAVVRHAPREVARTRATATEVSLAFMLPAYRSEDGETIASDPILW